jgi:hypothetical protein
MVGFRRSKRVGPFRISASKTGMSISGGVKGARVSVNSKGQAHRTTSIPSTGFYSRKRIGGVSRRNSNSASGGSAGTTIQVSKAIKAGRLEKRQVDRIRNLMPFGDDEMVQVALYLDATSGLELIEVRYRTSAVT